MKTFWILALLCPPLAHAELLVNEIIYDPAGTDDSREWIEVYNNSPSADVTVYTLFEGGSPGEPNGGTAILEFRTIAAVIALFWAAGIYLARRK